MNTGKENSMIKDGHSSSPAMTEPSSSRSSEHSKPSQQADSGHKNSEHKTEPQQKNSGSDHAKHDKQTTPESAPKKTDSMPGRLDEEATHAKDSGKKRQFKKELNFKWRFI